VGYEIFTTVEYDDYVIMFASYIILKCACRVVMTMEGLEKNKTGWKGLMRKKMLRKINW